MRTRDACTYIWEFHVRPDKQTLFERLYGADGAWVALFRRAPGYLGTLLLKDRANAQRYLTIDRWVSEEAYRLFRERFAEQYRALDDECRELTLEERSLGVYGE
jgi:heme-degrading monooxygenase HmoA